MGKNIKGLIIETSVQQNNKDIKIINQRIDATHSVEIINLMHYPASIDCIGEIKSYPQIVVAFSSTNIRDNKKYWSASKKGISCSQSCKFNHVKIIPLGNGTENISTTVQVVWPGWKPNDIKKETISLNVGV